MYKNDPKEITAKFKSACAETGKTINTGDTCVYYPTAKQTFHIDSKTAYEYRMWKADIDMGYDY